MLRQSIRVLFTASVLLTAGCAKPLAPPTAVAVSTPAVVAVGAIVQLDGTGSSDPNSPALPLVYHWRLVSLPPGSQARIDDPTISSPSFSADLAGAYRAELVVSTATLTSDPSVIEITAGPCGGNPPSATVVAAPSPAGVGVPVTFAPTATDADNGTSCQALTPTQYLTYAWALTAAPAASTAQLWGASARSPSLVPDVPGSYEVSLVVTDSTGRKSAPVATSLTVGTCGVNAPSIASPGPTAGSVGQGVNLTATVDDADNAAACQTLLQAKQALGYQWAILSAPAASRAVIANPDAPSAGFVPDAAGVFQLALTVRDSTGRSSTAAFSMTVDACGSNPPVASPTIAAASTLRVRGTVLAQSNVTDPDNAAGCSAIVTVPQTFTYRWWVAEAPAGGALPAGVSFGVKDFSFSPNVNGTWVLGVVATDSTGRVSAPAFVKAVVTDCGGHAPVAAMSTVSFVANSCSGGSVQNGCGNNNNNNVCCTVAPVIGMATAPIEVQVNAKPVAINGGSGLWNAFALQLDASASSDADNLAGCALGQLLSYKWEMLSVPPGGQWSWQGTGTGGGGNGFNGGTTVMTSTLVNPTLLINGHGDYQLRLTVSDGTLTSTPVLIQISTI